MRWSLYARSIFAWSSLLLSRSHRRLRDTTLGPTLAPFLPLPPGPGLLYTRRLAGTQGGGRWLVATLPPSLHRLGLPLLL